MIKKEGSKWVLFSKDGSKKLGSFDTEAEAKKREKEIIAAKEAKKSMVELSLTITKAHQLKDGTMRWQAVASTTNPDQREEQTTLALFEDMIERVSTGKSANFLPEPRMPFLGLSHYSDLDGFGEAGITEKMYIDGNRLKVSGRFNDNEVGKATFEAVVSERELIQKGETVEQPIRISAGWWDISHSHGNFVFERQSLSDKCPMCIKGLPRMFLKGQADHWACTRVPVNQETSIGLEEKSMATKKEDAASIVGDKLADELDKKDGKLTKKSEADKEPAMVIKADKEPIVERAFGGATTMQEADEFQAAREKTEQVWSNFDTFMMVVDNIMFDDDVQDKPARIAQAVKDFGDRVAALKANLSDAVMLQPVIKGEVIMSEDKQTPVNVLQMAIETGLKATDRQAALEAIQPALEGYVEIVKAQVDAKFPPDPAEQMTKAFTDALGPLTEQIGLIAAKLNQQPTQQPVQKSLMPGQIPVVNTGQELPVSPITGKPSTLTQMINKSVGLS